jgi:hypothetical protein
MGSTSENELDKNKKPDLKYWLLIMCIVMVLIVSGILFYYVLKDENLGSTPWKG